MDRGAVRLSRLVTLTVAVILATGCAPAPEPPPPNPLAGSRLWADPQSAAARAAAGLREQGRATDAEALEPIVSQPVATWLAADDPRPLTDRVVTQATEAGGLPVLVLYHRPDRDCGSHSAGGSPDDESYITWVSTVADAIGDRPAVVILEPDAVAQVLGDEKCADDRGAVFALLARAVGELTKSPKTLVFIDAGHPGWITDQNQLADALRRSGVERTTGFSLNVSNFHSDAENQQYGDSLSAMLGGAQYVVDVSRNGAGSPPAPPGSIDSWCNPPNAALGRNPRLGDDAAFRVADLWIKEPGASDGTCRPGEPPAGEFWLDYALGLIRRR